jgi:hypothetical protein
MAGVPDPMGSRATLHVQEMYTHGACQCHPAELQFSNWVSDHVPKAGFTGSKQTDLTRQVTR